MAGLQASLIKSKWTDRPWVVAILCGLNIIFTCALCGVVATQLDYQPQYPYCFLNVSGQVCMFTYITTGEVLLMSFSIVIPLLWVAKLRNWATPPLIGVYFSLALFTFFWQFVMSLTITLRGNQAQGSGIPGSTARATAFAFAWMGTSFAFLICCVLVYDFYSTIKRKKHDSTTTTKATTTTKFGSSEAPSSHGPDGSLSNTGQGGLNGTSGGDEDAAMKIV